MAVIVCFGDSNTWGSDPVSRNRFEPETRWTGVLRRELGATHTIIEEGLNGRTTNLDDLIEENRNGRSYLPACLESHRPFDLMTIMLGTNDLKARFGRSASDIAQSAAALGTLAARSACGIDGQAPRILLIAPPPVLEVDDLAEMFAGGAEKSQKFAYFYGAFAGRNGFDFLDAGAVIASSPVDGIHFEAGEHEKLGKAVAGKIREMLRLT